MLNVKNFGAVGDNSTDDYAAILQAFIAADAIGDSVYFPAGTYYVGQRIDINITRDLVIFGDGDVSRIGPRGAGGFIKITSTVDYATVKIRDLRVSACAERQTAFDVTCKPVAAIHSKKLLVMDSVTVDTGTHHTETALKMACAHGATLRNCLFNGPGLDNGRAIEIAALSVNVRISDSDFNSWMIGLACTVYQEGLMFSNGAMVYVKYGVVFFSSQALRNTLLQMSNFHIDARGAGSIAVWCDNVSAMQVTNCILIAEGTVMYLKRVFESGVSNSQIYGPAAYGILLENGNDGLSCVAVTIIGNNFRGQSTNIYADDKTRRIIAKHNTRNESDSEMKSLPLVTIDTGTDNEIG